MRRLDLSKHLEDFLIHLRDVRRMSPSTLRAYGSDLAAFLAGRFGPAYQAYAESTPIFWPDPRRYRDTDAVSFSPLALRRTFFDGLYFLAIFPVIELVEQLQASGYLPVLMSIY